MRIDEAPEDLIPVSRLMGRPRTRSENLNAAHLGRGPLKILSQRLLGQAWACHTETF